MTQIAFQQFHKHHMFLQKGDKIELRTHTLLEVMSRATPRGMNVTPTANSTGRTVPAVMIGCHAGNFCCLNFVSARHQ